MLFIKVSNNSLYDESGVVCYTYGNMGEVTQETRIYALPFLSSSLALSTQFTYDSWGRIQDITYPDNEMVSYAYDLGGQLQSISNNSSYTYLDNVSYDRFGAKVSQEYGNGLVTDYTYENLTRRLSQITVTDNSNNPYGDIQYAYDPVGNVTQVTSSCPWLNSQSFMETFTYDASDQLVSASETQAQSYQLAVTYGNWGKISGYSLAQTDLQQNVTTSEAQSYTYPASNNLQSSQSLFAPASVTIQKPRQPHSVQTFTFGINGSLRKTEVQMPVSNHNVEYFLFNSAANMKAYSYDKTDFAYYGYNASNTRTYKLSMLNMGQWVNGEPHPIHLQIQQAMFYPNAYINFNQNGEYTKHYYNGTERIASRLGNATLNNATTSNARLTTRSGQLEDRFRNDIRTLVYAGDIPMDMPPEPVSATLQTTGTSTDIFYYHTNHLGSTAFVTDQNQTVTQGFLYAPFGEITTEYTPLWQNGTLPKYAFNAKELDEETGMYYYEARYYKPPVFTSRDAMFEKYFWMTPYAYCANNPVKYVDPDGRDVILVIWASHNGKIGHAGIAISNYRKETDANGQTRMVPDGTYTYRDLWPGEGVGKNNFSENVPAQYGYKDKVTLDQLFKEDVSDGEDNRPCDGLIMFTTDYELDTKIQQGLNDFEESNPLYNGIKVNCSDYVEAALETMVGRQLPVDEKLSSKISATTPNQVYKTASTLEKRNILKDPGKKVKNGFIRAVSRGPIKQKIAESLLEQL